jgi:glyoxylase-like metal-dependent hydrolase (beta-lactamase superfamily II)
MDIQPSQLDYVILTHLQVDHVSGLDHVKEAKRIMTSEIEWKVAQKQIGYVPALTAVQKLIPSLQSATNIVTILPDRGDRYLDMVYDELWVSKLKS